MSDRRRGEMLVKKCIGCFDQFTTYDSSNCFCDDCRFAVNNLDSVPEKLQDMEEAEQIMKLDGDSKEFEEKLEGVEEREGEEK